jgi:uncharacterized cupin superfamily protein
LLLASPWFPLGGSLSGRRIRDARSRSFAASAGRSLRVYARSMVPEAELESTAAGLVPGSRGWFVLNARDARWIERPGRGHNLPFTGWTEAEAETYFPQVGVSLVRLGPGEPIGMYHWEADAEEFLVLAGEAVLIIEGEERRLRQWDFVHCPPEAKHMIVGAGESPCTVLAIGAREHQTGDWGAYAADPVARRHGVSVERDTTDSDVAYARYPPSTPTRYHNGWLPDS